MFVGIEPCLEIVRCDDKILSHRVELFLDVEVLLLVVLNLLGSEVLGEDVVLVKFTGPSGFHLRTQNLLATFLVLKIFKVLNLASWQRIHVLRNSILAR